MRLVDRAEYDFTYMSFGAGWQSTAMYVLSTLGLRGVPDADVAVFADTGDEPQWVYDQLAAVDRWGIENGGPPIYTVSKGHSLSDSMVIRQGEGKRFVSVPLYTIGPDGSREGMLRRQCTKEFKVEPIQSFVRTYLGYRPRYKVRERVRCLLGISIDEAIRMKPNRSRWITNAWPLVDASIARHECKEIVTGVGLPAPRKSACVFCPYRRDVEWAELKREAPEEFAKAVEFDHAIRDMTQRGRGRTHPAYVHRSGVPLDEVDFSEGDENQADLFGDECEGMCGV